MISVANDLLNNSPGLCWGADGRPNVYTKNPLTLIHTHAFICTLICIYSNIYTPTSLFSAQGVFCHPVSLACCSHTGCFRSPLPSFTDTTNRTVLSKQKSLDTCNSNLPVYHYPSFPILSLLQFHTPL